MLVVMALVTTMMTTPILGICRNYDRSRDSPTTRKRQSRLELTSAAPSISSAPRLSNLTLPKPQHRKALKARNIPA